jgi:hypothetical protein
MSGGAGGSLHTPSLQLLEQQSPSSLQLAPSW